MTVISEPKPRRRYGEAWTAGAVSFAIGTHARAIAMLVVVSLLAFLPGFFQIPPVDRDEARFAQATKQMIETGDYIDIKFQDETRYKKPVGIYWLQAGVVQLGDALGVPRARLRIWLYRIPSLIGAIGVVVATYWAALAFVSRRAAFLAGLIMATSILLGVEARLAKTDAVLSLTVVAAMGAMARAYLAEQGERSVNTHPLVTAAVFWTAIAFGILIKGPLILMIVGLAIVALAVTDRSMNWILRLKPAMGAIWVLALVLPWFIAIIVRSGDSFFVEAIGHDLLAKVESGQEGHGVPPGFYLLLFWVTFFPGAMLAGLAAPAVWRARSEPGAKFLLAWLVPSWIVFELVPTKLPHYVLPLYPAIAILIVGVVDGQSLSRNRWLVRGPMWWFILIAAAGVGLVALNVTIGQRLGLPSWAFAAAAAILALFAWTLYRVDGAEASLVLVQPGFLACCIEARRDPPKRELRGIHCRLHRSRGAGARVRRWDRCDRRAGRRGRGGQQGRRDERRRRRHSPPAAPAHYTTGVPAHPCHSSPTRRIHVLGPGGYARAPRHFFRAPLLAARAARAR